jgi:hypothetical protein
MCDILNQYGKNVSDTNSATTTSELAVVSANETTNVCTTYTPSDIALNTKNSNMAIDTTTAVFAGANFSGTTTINVMINKN